MNSAIFYLEGKTFPSVSVWQLEDNPLDWMEREKNVSPANFLLSTENQKTKKKEWIKELPECPQNV